MVQKHKMHIGCPFIFPIILKVVDIIERKSGDAPYSYAVRIFPNVFFGAFDAYLLFLCVELATWRKRIECPVALGIACFYWCV